MLISGLSCAKGFIKFKQVVFAHTLNNQRVSKSVFKVTRIIYKIFYGYQIKPTKYNINIYFRHLSSKTLGKKKMTLSKNMKMTHCGRVEVQELLLCKWRGRDIQYEEDK